MRDLYHEQLDTLNDELVELTQLVGSAMARATQSLLDADLGLAESVIAGDERIDVVNHDIEERCLQIIALQQPVATDLRIAVSGLRISTSLERMGDLAVHVAKQARLRYPRPAVPDSLQGTFAEMGALAQVIVTKTGSVLSTKDIHLAADIRRADDRMDEVHRELFTTVLSPSWTHGVEAAIDVTLLSRYYERYADHAVTIARRVVHIVTGEPYASIDVDSL